MSTELSTAETQTKFKDADQLFRAKKFPEALLVLDELDRDYPNVKNILYPKAMCLAHVGRHEEALEVCRQLKVEFGDPRADSLMSEISASRKAEVEKERDKKEHRVVGNVIPAPGVFQLDSSPPPMRDTGDLGFTGFDFDPTKLGADGSRGGIDAAGLDDMFARVPAPPPAAPKPAPRSNVVLYAGIGSILLLAAIAAFIVLAQ